MSVDKTTIFIISNELWGDVWFSKQHYANELSKLGYMVFFLNAPQHWSLKNVISWQIKRKEINGNLFVISYNNLFPVRVFSMFFMALNDRINYWKIKTQLKTSESTIMWTFDPLRFSFFPLSSNIIYHVADPYMSLKATSNFDPVISRKANLIICTSPLYEPFYRSKGHKNTLIIPHKISDSELNIDENKVNFLKNKFGKFILLVGSFNNDVSIETLETINKEIGNNLLFVGIDPKKAIYEKMKYKDRYHYIGPIHAKKIKNYIAASSICIVAYKYSLNKGIGSGSPLKILNYLAQYKPIISSIDTEINELKNKVIYNAKSSSEFINLINKGLKNELFVDEVAIKKYLSDHTYKNAINKILNCLNEK